MQLIISRPEQREETREWWNTHNKKLHNNTSPNTAIKTGAGRWVGHLNMTGKKRTV
jgi:hypothetical protein